MTKRIARIPLAGSLDARNIDGTLGNKDQRFINCIPEIIRNETSQSVSIFMNKRAGFAQEQQLFAGATGTALMVWNGASVGAATSPVVSAFRDGTNIKVFANAVQLYTSATSTQVVGFLSETTISGSPRLMALIYQVTGDIFNGADVIQENATHNSVTSATDSDFPTADAASGNMVHIGGYGLLMRKSGAKIQNSDLNSLTSYSPTGLFPCNVYPDFGVGLARTSDTVIAFCSNHIEFLRNAGNQSGSPLSRIPDSSIRVGLASHRAMAQVGDLIGFIGTSTDTGLYGFYLIENRQIKEVSPPHISKYISGMDLTSTWDAVFVDGFRSFGQTIFAITAKDSDANRVTLCYCVEANFWFEWAPGDNIYPCFTAGKNRVVYAASAFNADGKTFKMDAASPVYTDDGVAYTMTIQFGRSDYGTGNRKFVEYYELVADNQSSGTTTLQVQDADDGNWTTIGTFDMTATSKRIYRGGAFRARGHRLTHSADTAWRGQFLDIYGTVGSV